MPKLRSISETALFRALDKDILSLVGDAVICTDENACVLVFNRAAEECFGYQAVEIVGQQLDLLIPQRYRAMHRHEVRSFVQGGGSSVRLMGTRREVVGRHKNGKEFPVEAKISRRVIDRQTVLTVVLRDITERKEFEALGEAVARELDHRLKNMASVITSLISLSAADAADVEDFKTSLIGRVTALAKSQSVFRFGDERPTSDLAQIFRSELIQYRNASGTNIIIGDTHIRVAPNAAQLLALAVHELATNSVKYGALSSPEGRVIISFAPTTKKNATEISIVWQEAGGPPVEPPMHSGFGTTLIKKLVARSLGADVTIDYPRQGLICRIICPKTALDSNPAKR